MGWKSVTEIHVAGWLHICDRLGRMGEGRVNTQIYIYTRAITCKTVLRSKSHQHGGVLYTWQILREFFELYTNCLQSLSKGWPWLRMYLYFIKCACICVPKVYVFVFHIWIYLCSIYECICVPYMNASVFVFDVSICLRSLQCRCSRGWEASSAPFWRRHLLMPLQAP